MKSILCPLRNYIYQLTTAQVSLMDSVEGLRMMFNGFRSRKSYLDELIALEQHLLEVLGAVVPTGEPTSDRVRMIRRYLERECRNFIFTNDQCTGHRHFKPVGTKSEELYAKETAAADRLLAEYTTLQYESIQRILYILEDETVPLGYYQWNSAAVHLMVLLDTLWRLRCVIPTFAGGGSKNEFFAYFFRVFGLPPDSNVYYRLYRVEMQKRSPNFMEQLARGELVFKLQDETVTVKAGELEKLSRKLNGRGAGC